MTSLIRQLKSFFTSPLFKGPSKMVIVVRTDIPMGKGKVGAQCAHAALECFRQASSSKSHQELFSTWLRAGQPKIVLRIPNEQALLNLARDAKSAGLIIAVIRDAGKTQLLPGTVSVLGIGPAPNTIVDPLTLDLKLL